jgi:phage terminase large subunit-like protein
MTALATSAEPRRQILLPEDLRRPFRYATRPNPALRSRGRQIAALARGLGRPLFPHQRYITDVATEINPPGSSFFFFRYQRVIIAEPRQVGKTTTWRPVVLDRCLMAPGTGVAMTAQQGKDASHFFGELIEDLEHSPFGSPEILEIGRSKGSEYARFRRNRSTAWPFAPVVTGLHGRHPDLVGVDEAWAHTMESGRNLMRAIRPAQLTRPAKQLWIMSAAGSADSEWWNELVEIGRASVDDPNSTTAYFEHSAETDEHGNLVGDPYAPATWQFHPGLDGLTSEAVLADEAKPENNTHADFLRGFLNVSTKIREHTVLDLNAWALLARTQERPDPDTVTYAYDLAIDRTTATIYAAWTAPDGHTDLKVLRTGEQGEQWLADVAANLYRDTGRPLHTWDGGPATQVTDALTRDGIPVETVTGSDRSTAWIAFKAAAESKQLHHDGDPALRHAIEVAVERDTDDDTRPSRRRSLGAIDPLLAAAAARWFADRATPAVQVF